MKQFVVTVSLSESGSVEEVILTDDNINRTVRQLSTYGWPYLGTFEDSESFRDALQRQAIEDIKSFYQVEGRCLGTRLAYVSPGHTLYVMEVDFDS